MLTKQLYILAILSLPETRWSKGEQAILLRKTVKAQQRDLMLSNMEVEFVVMEYLLSCFAGILSGKEQYNKGLEIKI